MDLEQAKRRMEAEKDELILALEDLEFALEKAENRTININRDVDKLKMDHERKLEDKDIEIRNSKLAFQNAIDTTQLSIETERKAQAETIRSNQKLQNSIHDLESALDHANRWKYTT